MQPMTLRALRLWHWNRATTARANAVTFDKAAELWEEQHATRCRHNRNKARDYHRKANFHIGCVQALNDVVDGTAEDDARGVC